MKRTALALTIIFLTWGCMTFNRSYKLGSDAEMNKDFDEAIKYYEMAALENPREPTYRLALLRTKAAASLYYLQEARALAAEGKRKEAVSAYDRVLAYDPLNRIAYQERTALLAPPEKTEPVPVQELGAPVTLLTTGEKLMLNFPTDVSLKSIFRTLGKMTGVNFLYDEGYRDVQLSVDLSGKELEQAISYLCLASKNFYRVIDEKTVIIIRDEPMKRLQYEVSAIKTFYLSNVIAQDVQGPLTALTRSLTVPRQPNIQVDKNLNAITIRDSPRTIALAEKLLRMWDKPKGEIIVDLEIMEVSRIKLQQLGIDLSQSVVGFRLNPEGGTGDPGWLRINSLGLGDPGNYQITIPSAILQFLEGDADTKLIAKPSLRGISGAEMKYLVGQKVPVPQASFNPIAAGGLATQPVVQYTQQDVGIDILLTPQVHYEGEVTLEVEIKISSIAGAGVADIPIISTREIKNTVRLKDGETNLLAGLLQDRERKTLTGIVGIKDIPLIGSLFSSTDTEIEQTDVILTLTPYIIRHVSLTEEDKALLWVDSDSISVVTSAAQQGVEETPVEERQAPPPQPEAEENLNIVFITPSSLEVNREREFRVTLALRAEDEIQSLSLDLTFNPQVLQLRDAVEGGIIRQLGENVPFLKNIDNSAGTCTLGFSGPTLGRGIRGGGALATLVFTSTSPGEAMIAITNCTANGSSGQPLLFDRGEARVSIR